MTKLRLLFGSVEFQAVAFCVFLFLYVWPLHTALGAGRPMVLYLYFYGVLFLHICCLLLISSSLKNRPDKGEGGGPGGDRPW